MSVTGGWEWTGGRTRLGSRIGTVVGGLTMRTPYGGLRYVPPVEVAPPGELVGFDHSLFLQRATSSWLSFRGDWTYGYLRHPEPRDLRFAGHRFSAGAVVRPWGSR